MQGHKGEGPSVSLSVQSISNCTYLLWFPEIRNIFICQRTENPTQEAKAKNNKKKIYWLRQIEVCRKS